MNALSHIVRAAIAAIIALAPSAAQACAVCFAEPDNAQTHGMNAAMGLLLAVVVAAGAALVYLIRVAGNPPPPDSPQPPFLPPQG